MTIKVQCGPKTRISITIMKRKKNRVSERRPNKIRRLMTDRVFSVEAS